MVFLNNSDFLKELTVLCNSTSTENEDESSNSVWITMKRGKREPLKKKTGEISEAKDKKTKRTVKECKNSNKVSFLIRATDGKKKKISTKVTENAHHFMQEVNKAIKSSIVAKNINTDAEEYKKRSTVHTA